MKNKGFTMTELMVSIVIIAVVMVFLTRLLVDVRYDFSNELYDTSNTINRAEIIKTVQNDMNGKIITGINDNDSSDNKLIINLITSDNSTGTITVQKDYFTYKTINGDTKKWKLEKNSNETYIKTTNIDYEVIRSTGSDADQNDYLITINIPVIVDSSSLRTNNDSNMDNFIFTFYGYGDGLTNGKTTLNEKQ
jgi:prepilin-type N-terminal cleavage/methylation domain-containing protein